MDLYVNSADISADRRRTVYEALLVSRSALSSTLIKVGTNGAAASCFPCGTGLASSFDVNLLTRVGGALGDECHARGVHVLLGPTVNIQRHPCGGRGFESFSEGQCHAHMLSYLIC